MDNTTAILASMFDKETPIPEEISAAYMSRNNAVVKIDALPDSVILCVINKYALANAIQHIRFFKVENLSADSLSSWLRGETEVLLGASPNTMCLLSSGVTLEEFEGIADNLLQD